MEYVLSSRKRRFFASLIDGIISGGLAFLTFFILSLTHAKFLEISMREMFDKHIVYSIIYILITLVPIIVFEIIIPTYIWSGQTIAKKLLGIKVIKDTEEVVTIKTMTLRSILTLLAGINIPVFSQIMSVVGLIDSLFIFNDDKKTLHDIIAKTKVIYC
ncbi:RDD family protein [Bacillus sp. AFS053548]|uniref:RDD family protein n=1 Tax=Bacillus sp. AFS053548 TaxID=2033505 RepID=UPI000BFC7D6C|nr:RDD family protein [Bacillus sp. AFS053548]PGM54179.1 hypothetical protein CN946_16385 [Bacillus sp. AFS053548]